MPAAALLAGPLAIVGGTGWWALRRPTRASSFSGQPALLKLATGLALYNAFLYLEYFVINPSGVWRHLPLYRAECISPWDFVVPLLIGLLVWFKGFRPSRQGPAVGGL